MTQQLVVTKTGEIIDPQEPATLTILDVYSPEPVAYEAPRLDAIATLSAGYKKAGQEGHAGTPVVSRDGTLYLHDPKGRAPGLKAALDAGGQKRLTIAFPFNNPSAFVQQRFTAYSATHLLAYGDEYSITTIDAKSGARQVLEAGTDEYDAARKSCKVSTSIYFALAEWTAQGPRMVWPDGLGLYRLRTTSRNTLRNLRAALAHVSSFTGGQVAGIPFDLALDYRDVAGPDGSRRNVPCFTFTMAPPVPLTSRTFAPMLSAAIREGHVLQIAPPGPEGEDVAEGDFRDLADDEAALMASGGRCDARYYEGVFFATVKGTRFASEVDRAWLLDEYTEAKTESLAYFLEHATEAEASAFIAHVSDLLDAERKAAAPTRLPGQRGGESALDLQRRLMGDGEEPPPAPTAPDGTLEQWLAKYQAGMRLVRERGLDEARWELPSDAGLEDVRAAVLSISAAIKAAAGGAS